MVNLVFVLLPVALVASQATFADLYQPQGFGYHAKEKKGGKEVAVARAYNISDPVFTCPKPGYELIGEECVFIDTVQARWECPIGYQPEGGTPGRPADCVRRSNPVSTCPRGRLEHGVCVISHFSDPVTSCPTGSEEQPDGTCVKYEPVHPVERCPEGSDRINGACVRIHYSEPTYICPHDTVQEGKKCRREVVSFKHKGRALSANFLGREEEMDLEDSDFDMFSDLPEHVFQSDEGSFEGEGGCKSGDCPMPKSTWLPAYVTKPTKPPKVIYTEGLKWQKIHVQVPVMVPQKNTPPPKPPKVIKEKEPKEPKPPKVKVVKAPAPPQKVIKVQYIPAEKVCHEGEKHGGACVTQIPVPPITECPVPLIHGICQRAIPVTPITTCTVGQLVCPPRVPGTKCQCETTTETTPIQTCPQGILDPVTNKCVSHAQPKEYCPLGYFLDHNKDTCTKRDVEAAICIFSVTYLCPDCEKY